MWINSHVMWVLFSFLLLLFVSLVQCVFLRDLNNLFENVIITQLNGIFTREKTHFSPFLWSLLSSSGTITKLRASPPSPSEFSQPIFFTFPVDWTLYFDRTIFLLFPSSFLSPAFAENCFDAIVSILFFFFCLFWRPALLAAQIKYNFFRRIFYSEISFLQLHIYLLYRVPLPHQIFYA